LVKKQQINKQQFFDWTPLRERGVVVVVRKPWAPSKETFGFRDGIRNGCLGEKRTRAQNYYYRFNKITNLPAVNRTRVVVSFQTVARPAAYPSRRRWASVVTVRAHITARQRECADTRAREMTVNEQKNNSNKQTSKRNGFTTCFSRRKIHAERHHGPDASSRQRRFRWLSFSYGARRAVRSPERSTLINGTVGHGQRTRPSTIGPPPPPNGRSDDAIYPSGCVLVGVR